MAEKTTTKQITSTEYGIVLAVVIGFGVGLMLQSIEAGVLLGVPVGFVVGYIYGNNQKK
jgi:hypothetical protein